MALIYFYDSTELDKQQLTNKLQPTDHHWEYIDDSVSLYNLNPDTEVLSVFVTSNVTRQIISALPKLKLIACRSTGYNNVDIIAAKERGIEVVNVPTYGEATVAEYAFALLLALTRKLPQAFSDKDMIPGELLRGVDLAGKTIAVIGTGHIGARVVSIALGFGMNVIAHDPKPNKDLSKKLGFKYCDLDDAISEADVVSLHVPYMTSTHHLINQERLTKFKNGSYLINTARGELIDTKALISALHDGQISGVALDVIEGEHLLNLDEEVQLLRSGTLPTKTLEHSVEIMALKHMPNVIITPHNAFNTVQAIERINNTTAQNIIDFWFGNSPNIIKAPAKNFGKLILVRHAESEWNATGQWTGITDVHLSEKGFHEAGILGKAVENLDIIIDKAYCSQQIRTLETLEGILDASGQLDVPIERVGAINERDYGDYTGKNKWEVRDLVGEEQFNKIRRGWNIEVPNGETLKQVYERAVPFYLDVILPQIKDGKNILIVGHGNSIRSLIKYLESISDEAVENLEMIFGEVLVYDVDENGLSKAKKISVIDTEPPNA